MGNTLQIERVLGPVFVQASARKGWMHHAVPPGGALVPTLLRNSNRAVGNRDDAAALELFGPMEFRAERELVCALDGVPTIVPAGSLYRVRPAERQRVSYLAVAGGIDVPLVLGSRGTLVCARLGGHEGRALRRGDVLAVGDEQVFAPTMESMLHTFVQREFPVFPGPDLQSFAPDVLRLLEEKTFRISVKSDRVGVRLEGATLPRLGEDQGISSPMVRGAMEVTASGEVLVLGPEHPTTGGYPLVAVLDEQVSEGFFLAQVGTEVRFSVVL